MEISHSQPFMHKLINPFQKAYFFKLHKKYPRISFILSLSIAAVGILFLVIFPFFLVILPSQLYDTVVHAETLKNWIDSAILFVAIILSGGFSWTIYKLKFSVPTGLDVTAEKFPHLFKLIEELREDFGNPAIDKIILRDKYEIRVIKTPRSGIPFLNTSTLIIGLPVLQTMSPLYFRALLARKVGQLSTQHTPITTRLYYLSDIWQQFKTSCKNSNSIFAKVLGYYFQLYCSLYQTLLAPLLQKEELEADSYGMDLINDHDMVECLVYEAALLHFLENKFWPKIYHLAKRSKTPEFLPYSQMTKVVKAGITNDEISEAIQAALSLDINNPGPMPSLRGRLNHLGHSKPLAPKRLSKTAAEYYLGKNLEKIIGIFDKRWLKKIQNNL